MGGVSLVLRIPQSQKKIEEDALVIHDAARNEYFKWVPEIMWPFLTLLSIADLIYCKPLRDQELKPSYDCLRSPYVLWQLTKPRLYSLTGSCATEWKHLELDRRPRSLQSFSGAKYFFISFK